MPGPESEGDQTRQDHIPFGTTPEVGQSSARAFGLGWAGGKKSTVHLPCLPCLFKVPGWKDEGQE